MGFEYRILWDTRMMWKYHGPIPYFFCEDGSGTWVSGAYRKVREKPHPLQVLCILKSWTFVSRRMLQQGGASHKPRWVVHKYDSAMRCQCVLQVCFEQPVSKWVLSSFFDPNTCTICSLFATLTYSYREIQAASNHFPSRVQARKCPPKNDKHRTFFDQQSNTTSGRDSWFFSCFQHSWNNYAADPQPTSWWRDYFAFGGLRKFGVSSLQENLEIS